MKKLIFSLLMLLSSNALAQIHIAQCEPQMYAWKNPVTGNQWYCQCDQTYYYYNGVNFISFIVSNGAYLFGSPSILFSLTNVPPGQTASVTFSGNSTPSINYIFDGSINSFVQVQMGSLLTATPTGTWATPTITPTPTGSWTPAPTATPVGTFVMPVYIQPTPGTTPTFEQWGILYQTESAANYLIPLPNTSTNWGMGTTGDLLFFGNNNLTTGTIMELGANIAFELNNGDQIAYFDGAHVDFNLGAMPITNVDALESDGNTTTANISGFQNVTIGGTYYHPNAASTPVNVPIGLSGFVTMTNSETPVFIQNSNITATSQVIMMQHATEAQIISAVPCGLCEAGGCTVDANSTSAMTWQYEIIP